MIAAAGGREPIVCQSCGADPMSCDVKRGLGGRPCCDDCDHRDRHEHRDHDRKVDQ